MDSLASQLLRLEDRASRLASRWSAPTDERELAKAIARELRVVAVLTRSDATAARVATLMVRAFSGLEALEQPPARPRGRPVQAKYTDEAIATAMAAAAGSVRAAARASGIPRSVLSRRVSHATARDTRSPGIPQRATTDDSQSASTNHEDRAA